MIKNKDYKNRGISLIIKLVMISIFMMIFSGMSYAIPLPHGIDGIVYELDGITQAGKGIDFYVHNLNSSHIVYGKTGHGSPGRYSASIKGNDGDTIIVRAWNGYNQVNETLILRGVMRNADLLLNMTYPENPPVITSEPMTEAETGKTYRYDAEAFDPDGDILEYSLADAPDGMKINRSSGLIEWKPKKRQEGDNPVTINVSDGKFSALQPFIITVYSKKPRDKVLEWLKDYAGMRELNERPHDVRGLDRRTYKYLEIEKQIEDSEDIINFSIELDWFRETGVGYGDVVLSRYTKAGWTDLPTYNVSKDDRNVYYNAKTPGYSYFSINVREMVKVKSIIEPSISGIKRPYRLSGFIYRFAGMGQVREGTRIEVQNMNTSEVFTSESGVGPYSGAYHMLLYGNKGDMIKVSIGGSKEFFIGLDDKDADFMSNLRGTRFFQLHGPLLHLIIRDAAVILLLFSALSFFLIRRISRIKHKNVQ